MKTSEKVSIFAYIEREEGITVPSSQSPHARRTIAARVCLQSECRISEEILHFFASIFRGVYFVALNYPFTFKTCRYASGEKERYGGQERFFVAFISENLLNTIKKRKSGNQAWLLRCVIICLASLRSRVFCVRCQKKSPGSLAIQGRYRV